MVAKGSASNTETAHKIGSAACTGAGMASIAGCMTFIAADSKAEKGNLAAGHVFLFASEVHNFFREKIWNRTKSKDNVYRRCGSSKESPPLEYITVNGSANNGSMKAVVQSLNARFSGASNLRVPMTMEECPPPSFDRASYCKGVYTYGEP
jgi:hypothetical protein